MHNPAYHSGETLRFSNGVAVPIFIRSAEEYNAIAARAGFVPLLEEYPPFTEEFIARYPTYAGTTRPGIPHPRLPHGRDTDARTRRPGAPDASDGALAALRQETMGPRDRGKRVAVWPSHAGLCGMWPREEMMQHSDDVRDAFVRFLADVSSGSDAWADRFACTEDGASLIGTDDTEWYQGGAMRAAWTGWHTPSGRRGCVSSRATPTPMPRGRSVG